MSRIDEIRERWAAATPGPWTKWVDHSMVFVGDVSVNEPYGLKGGLPIFDADEDTYEELYGEDWDQRAQADAHAIAHAPDDLAYLLDRVEKLDSWIERSLGEKPADADHAIRLLQELLDDEQRLSLQVERLNGLLEQVKPHLGAAIEGLKATEDRYGDLAAWSKIDPGDRVVYAARADTYMVARAVLQRLQEAL